MDQIRELVSEDEWRDAHPAFESLRPKMGLRTLLDNREICQKSGYRLFGGYRGGVIVTVAGITIRSHIEFRRQMEIEDLSTHPAHLRRGYARELLEFLIVLAKREQCFRIKLNSGMKRIEAHALYQALGMERTGYHYDLRF